jgi:putative Mn2+ efflux pump MntP
MNQAGYMILHVALIVTLDRIEVALSMGLGTTRKNMQKHVLPRTVAFLFQVMTATQ